MPRTSALAFVAVLALTGCATAEPSATPPSTSSSSATATTGPTAPAPSRYEPTEVGIPKIAARSSLVPLGLNPDETIEVPPVEQPMQAGWYTYARAPGEPGPAIILGHVDGDSKPGIFHRLRELAPGDQVEVSRKDGSTVRFAVEKVDQVAKNDFPTDAVYGDTPEPVLRLITCGGVFDNSARSYQDNIIVYAKMI
ncbi:sortase (surface protein transpeptidase) [Saccharothrix tamanrassetensis]|uniref:Sortase (Surface protein transpeptidase) n=1 Tax=Saccharothrix tamanrassetensis TaxID=1051531 RepID=A0A841CFX9_9PSEU|nr:class F sortase [Saccharothrix tamanrassetensis]MBB5955088.1 sortase (surface protein transpeptidase) [Saccharothrix tamanrassetensis]